MTTTTYKNLFYNKHYQGSRERYECDKNPIIYRGYEIHQYSFSQWHIVIDGECIGMNAGLNGAKRRIDQILKTDLKDGDKIEILCHNNKTNVNEWLPGIFHHTVTALDREYRINCSLSTGQNIREAAPECVRPL